MPARTAPSPLPLDPALGAIYSWRVARANACRAEAHIEDDEDAFDATLAERKRALAHALATLPTTREGLRAYCEFGAELALGLKLDSGCGLSEFTPIGWGEEHAVATTAEDMFLATLVRAEAQPEARHG